MQMEINMTSKERAFLRSKANPLEAIINVGKESASPEVVSAVDEALTKRELIKINILKNCDDDKREIADLIALRTKSEVIQIVGRKVTLYRRNQKIDRYKIV